MRYWFIVLSLDGVLDKKPYLAVTAAKFSFALTPHSNKKTASNYMMRLLNLFITPGKLIL